MRSPSDVVSTAACSPTLGKRAPATTEPGSTATLAPRSPLRPSLAERVLWYTLGFVRSTGVAWLIFRGYRQAELLLDFGNTRLR